MAIARFGSSPHPMDNYRLDVLRDESGAPHVPTDPAGRPKRVYRVLSPHETLQVNAQTGAIDGVTLPDAVQFRDAEGRVKPVCPFLEVWAQFEDGGNFEPLTTDHLAALGLSASDLRWRIRAANLKPYRRTADPGDKVEADLGPFSDHAAHALIGHCPNFKPGKSIAFGKVRYIQPNADFKEIRLRFTPGAGLVFGPNAIDRHPRDGSQLTNDDVYAGNAGLTSAAAPDGGWPGKWDRYWIGKPGTNPVTAPGDIFQGETIGDTKLSHGYLDDTCDGIAEVRLQVGGADLRAYARFAVAVPDFAPDSLPVRSIADDLEQMALGPDVQPPSAGDTAGEQQLLGEVADIMRRGLETVQQINTMVMNGDQDVGDVPRNGNNMPGQQTGYGRAFEPIYDTPATAPFSMQEYFFAVRMHANRLSRMLSSTSLQGAFDNGTQRVRRPWQVNDLTTQARQLMPVMMRGNEGLDLCLTLRQIAKLGLADRSYDPDMGRPAPVEAAASQGISPVSALSRAAFSRVIRSDPPDNPQ